MRPVALAALLLLGAVASQPVLAAADVWALTNVRGVVVYLNDDKWEEVTRGQSFAAATLRTLRSGRLRLEAEDLTVDIGPDTAVILSSKPDGTASVIQQYAGQVDIAVGDPARSGKLTLQAGKLLITGISGALTVKVGDTQTALTVQSGNASIKAAGRTALIGSGNYVVDTAGGLTIAAGTGPANSATSATAPGRGKGLGAGNANSNASSSGGNGGGGGNASSGGGNGNASSGGGNGNASSGGRNGNASSGGGNGNASSGGGSGNASSSGGNGNASSGGNGNGNGNGDANSHAGK